MPPLRGTSLPSGDKSALKVLNLGLQITSRVGRGLTAMVDPFVHKPTPQFTWFSWWFIPNKRGLLILIWIIDMVIHGHWYGSNIIKLFQHYQPATNEINHWNILSQWQLKILPFLSFWWTVYTPIWCSVATTWKSERVSRNNHLNKPPKQVLHRGHVPVYTSPV